jgi:hypothetical protein
MLSNSLTHIVSILSLICYFAYIMVMHGTVGFLISSAILLLLASFLDHIEHITIGLLIIGLSISIYVRQHPKLLKKEGFEDGKKESDKEVPLDNDPALVASTTAAKPSTKTVTKETTAIADTYDQAGTSKAAEPTATKAAPGKPTPEPAIDAAAVTKGVQDAMDKLKKTTANTMAATQDSTASKAGSSENFQEPSAGLFKLGELPSEMKQGPFVDVATTMTKAMGSLQPDQIKAMTEESQSLLDTQKNLMNMLQSMRPVLQDGRQLLDTFGSIFSGLGSMGGTNINGKA